MAFIDIVDQFLALSRGRSPSPDTGRHFALVVDDRTIVMDLALAVGATVPEGRPYNFLDPRENHIEVVQYRDIQFTKTSSVLSSLGVSGEKSDEAQAELRKKGLS